MVISSQAAFASFRIRSTLPLLFVAKTILLAPKEIESRLKLNTDKLTDEVFEKLFSAVHDKKIGKDAVFEALVSVCEGKELDISKFGSLSEADLESRLRRIISDHPKMAFNGLIGKAMEELRGKADGKKIVELLKKLSG